jgi:hypothetical protein
VEDNQRKEVKIDGSSLELDANWVNGQSGLYGFLSEHARQHPWIIGIVAICGTAVLVPAEAVGSTIIGCVAIISIAVITIKITKRK